MKRKLMGFLGLAALVGGLLWSNSESQVGIADATAVLELHDFTTSGTDSIAGIDLTTNTLIYGIQVWVDNDSVDFRLASSVDSTAWTIVSEFSVGGNSYFYMLTQSPGKGLSSGHVIDVIYTGAAELSIISTTQYPSRAQTYYGGYLTNVPTTVTGSIPAGTTEGVATITLHNEGTHGHSGIDVVSNVDVVSMTFVLDTEYSYLRIAPGDSLPSTWYKSYDVLLRTPGTTEDYQYRLVIIQTDNYDSTFTRGHALDVRHNTPGDSVTCVKGVWGNPSEYSYTTSVNYIMPGSTFQLPAAITISGEIVADTDSFALQGARPGVMTGFDTGHSGIFPAVFPDTLEEEWVARGFTEGAPTFHIGNFVISMKGTFGITDTDSSLVTCRVDTTGTLVWATAIPDSLVSSEGYSWPIGAWIGADSLVYATRAAMADQAAPIYALNLDDGTIAWESEHKSFVTPTMLQGNGMLILDDGDLIGYEFSTGEYLKRINATNGETVWSADPAYDFTYSGFQGALVAWKYDGVEYFASLVPDNSVEIRKTSDGSLVSRRYLDDSAIPDLTRPHMTSNSALCDSLTPASVILAGGYWDNVDFESWVPGTLGEGNFKPFVSDYKYNWPSSNFEFFPWIQPFSTDSVKAALAVVPSVMTGTRSFITAAMSGRGTERGYDYNRTLWRMPDQMTFMWTGLTDQEQNVIILWRGQDPSNPGGKMVMLTDTVDQSPTTTPGSSSVESVTETFATKKWERDVYYSNFSTNIAANGRRFWVNYNGNLVGYNQSAVIDSIIIPPPKPPIGQQLVEP